MSCSSFFCVFLFISILLVCMLENVVMLDLLHAFAHTQQTACDGFKFNRRWCTLESALKTNIYTRVIRHKPYASVLSGYARNEQQTDEQLQHDVDDDDLTQH